MTKTMPAAVLDAPGPPEALTVRNMPVPEPKAGWVLIEVKAFGLNRSELHTRLGMADDVTFPRVLSSAVGDLIGDRYVGITTELPPIVPASIRRNASAVSSRVKRCPIDGTTSPDSMNSPSRSMDE